MRRATRLTLLALALCLTPACLSPGTVSGIQADLRRMRDMVESSSPELATRLDGYANKLDETREQLEAVRGVASQGMTGAQTGGVAGGILAVGLALYNAWRDRKYINRDAASDPARRTA